MKYYGEIIVEENEAKLIRELLENEPQNEEECYGEDETICNSFEFENGMLVDVKLCGVQYEEDGCNMPWTEMVLFKINGGCCNEVACTEVSEDYFGLWSIDYNGDTYEVEVI